MNLKAVKDLVTSKTARQILLTKKHSPRILFVAGTIGVVGATVLACRATLKMEEVLDKAEEKTLKAKSLHTRVHAEEMNTSYTDQDLNKDLAKIRIQTALEVTKLYAPAIGVGILSIAALTGSHIVLTKRNTAVMAAYAAVQKGYDEYRQRVQETYGVDVDRQFAAGAESITVEEKTSDGKTTKTKVDTLTGRYGGSPYAVVFNEFSPKFSREPGRNRDTIMMLQSHANDKLRAKGHLLLNDVYDLLQLPRTKAGCVVGWVYHSDSDRQKLIEAGKPVGDNFVSFGVFDHAGEPAWVEAFIEGTEKCAVLDFNVDGVIYDQL